MSVEFRLIGNRGEKLSVEDYLKRKYAQGQVQQLNGMSAEEVALIKKREDEQKRFAVEAEINRKKFEEINAMSRGKTECPNCGFRF